MSRRFSDFLITSSFFNSNNCSRTVLAKTSGFARNWPLAHAKFACAYKLYPSGRQPHAKFTRVAASRMQHQIKSAEICQRLAATRVQFACDWWPLRYKTRDKSHGSATATLHKTKNIFQKKQTNGVNLFLNLPELQPSRENINL